MKKLLGKDSSERNRDKDVQVRDVQVDNTEISNVNNISSSPYINKSFEIRNENPKT